MKQHTQYFPDIQMYMYMYILTYRHINFLCKDKICISVYTQTSISYPLISSVLLFQCTYIRLAMNACLHFALNMQGQSVQDQSATAYSVLSLLDIISA